MFNTRDKASKSAKTLTKEKVVMWIVSEIDLKDTSPIIVINIYRPSKVGKGTNSVERQQINLIHDSGIQVIIPGQKFPRDLNTTI